VKSEQGLFVVKVELQEAGKAEDPENRDSDSSSKSCSGELVVELGDIDSGDDLSSGWFSWFTVNPVVCPLWTSVLLFLLFFGSRRVYKQYIMLLELEAV